MSQLSTYSGDTIGAKGNSGDMVIKVENRDDRRSEVRNGVYMKTLSKYFEILQFLIGSKTIES